MSFKVGQKVVCVITASGINGEAMPVVNEIYTVRGIIASQVGLGMCLLLSEVVNSPRNYKDGRYEVAHPVWAFRPIDYSFGEKVAEEITKEVEIKHRELEKVLFP